MEVHFYNHVNKSTFKSALISGTVESASILHGAQGTSNAQNRCTFKSTTNKNTFEYAFLTRL